jgi:sugar lactone lactonase YvrE
VADADGDADGDGVCNLLEYRGIDGRPPLLVLDPTNAPTIAGANPDDTGDALRPDAPDTDDDGIQDSVEWGLTRPNDPRDPPSPRWMCFGGGAGDCLVVSNAATHGLEAWTIDVWVTPSNGTAAAGTIVRSVVRKASGSSAMTNYVMGLATNGAGELVPYVGFATSTGQFTIAGGAIPAGTATHLAGTYDSVVGRLRLYVNGIETNNGISARVIPPADGVTTLIMGEGFVGALDEVRVWNSPLTVEEIADVRLHTVDPANPALVHYFRFDDGGVSAQDFKFMKDWTNRWAHAAMLKGDVHFGQGGWPSPSPLQVIVTPDRAIAAGAQWQVSTTSATNWSAWMDSRAFVWGLTTGEHRIAYQPLAGWTVPETNTVTITNDDAFVWTATYTELTGVKVQIQPAEAVTTGAQWTVDGGGWADSGGFIASIAGTHTVTFKPVDGWAHPAAMTVPVLDGSNTWLRVPYCPMTVLSTNRQFRSPRGLVVDSKRVLYVSDWENSRILLLNPATEQWETLADVGSGLGQVRQPMGLTIDTADNLYVADAGNNRIQKRTAATGQWTAWGTGQTVYPSDVAVGAGAVLFVADRGNNRVLRIAPDGACTPLLVAYELVLPSGIAIGPTGNMLVADYPASPPNSVRVQEFTAAGVFVRKWGSSSSGEGLLSASGKMYGMVFSGARVTVADTGNNRLAAATNLLVWSAVPGSGPLNAPEDLTYDGRGYLYVSDTGNNRVLLIQPPEAGAGPDVALRPRGASGASSLFDISLSAGWRWRHVEYADLLSTNTTWQLLPGYSGVDSSGSSVVITNGPGVTQRFYRVIAY